jgi:hypothetical protein
VLGHLTDSTDPLKMRARIAQNELNAFSRTLMNRDAKSWLMVLGLMLSLSWMQVGCASSEAEPQCSSDQECAPTESCDTQAGVCQANIRNDNNTSNDLPDATIDPLACDPACTTGERCDNGTCVPETTDPTCTQKGESCDPAVGDQGSFWCAGDGDGDGECLPKCSNTISAEGCGVAEYCWNVGSQDDPAPACIDSDCQSNSDCPSGTCLNFDNQFGLCLPSGSTPAGQSCDPSATNTCQPGLMCLSEPSGSTTGVCKSLCDMWTAPSCAGGQLCDLFTSREGVCTSDIDSSGSEPYMSCSTAGDVCDHGIPCIGFADGSNGCMPYCRPGMGDCPPAGGAQVVCNNYVSPGQRTWGLCLGACSTSADCSGGPCQQGICRTTCTAGNEVQDCCGGDADCDWTCVAGLCE